MSQHATKQVVIGDRTFAISKLTLGTLRRHGSALKTIMEMSPDAARRVLPTREQFDAMIALVHGSIVGGSCTDGASSPPTLDEFVAFTDGLDYEVGMVDIFTRALPVVMEYSGFAKLKERAAGEATGAAPST